MFQNDEYQYIGLTISQLSEGLENSSILGEFILDTSILSESEAVQGKVRLSNISNFIYDTHSINQVLLHITPKGGKKYEVKVYKKFSTPEDVMLETVELWVDDPSLQHDTINYIQWRV